MHELVTVDFRNVDRHLGVGRPGGCKGKDGYQGDADALPWHKTLHTPSSALRCGSTLTTMVNFPSRRAPSPQIRARDTSLDRTTNGSAGINSAPNVDAGINGATHLGGQRCRDHEDDGGDSTNHRKLAEHNLSRSEERRVGKEGK